MKMRKKLPGLGGLLAFLLAITLLCTPFTGLAETIIDQAGIDTQFVSATETIISFKLNIVTTFGLGLTDYGIMWYKADQPVETTKMQSMRIGEVSGATFELTSPVLSPGTAYVFKAYVVKDGETHYSTGFNESTKAQTHPTPAPTPTLAPHPTPAPTPTPRPETGIKGDVNNDTKVDINDLMTLMNYLVNRTPCPSMKNADANGSGGDPDIHDFVWIVGAIVIP